MSYYVSPRFLNKLAVHITKNYLDLPRVKVPLILGVHGRKGEGKTFQCELVFKRMGVEVVYISGGELESPDAGDPARLVRLRYREAAELVKVRGKMAVLMINDLDAGAGRFDRMTQYTVNTQLVNNTLMNIADNPTNVQLPGSYDETELPRIPIIATGNDFATLYAPLIRDGRMQKFYWEPNAEERLGVVSGMFAEDGLGATEVEQFVDRFKGQAIDFFGAVRSQIYDEQITQFIYSVGVENVSSKVVNAIKPPAFAKPNFQLKNLIAVGESLVYEQERVRTMGLVSEYNQAVTPAGRAFAVNGSRDRRYEESPLLMPPADNPLRPYGMSDQFPSPETKRAKDAAPNADNRLPKDTWQLLCNILAQGQKLGIEHVDQRRFRVNSWQSYGTLHSSDEAEAIALLQSCLQDFPQHYVRLVSIDPQTNRRIAEPIVQRP
ncbi:MAG: ribulose 1,5-bisphosphate carboxylase [Leptolyngbya foveolarum]|uniref:Ribulose 1,5-bisphosphate carboxylase n=1 Tax=Leptolyngbya foveolarum TaxID=47253 RepID=A0A2W4UAS9_9CYAN|nr:MAG: ribulose 1,5-bisphosphate carboxylase [Leptolyngbya foveolarum]